MYGAGNQGVWTFSAGGDKKLQPFVDSPSIEKHSAFSPDGRWLAYMLAGVGNAEPQLFVQPFPATGATYQVSTTGGRAPVWSRDGKSLFFHQLNANQLVVVDVKTSPSFSNGNPIPIPIEGSIHPQMQRNYDVTPDGKEFLVVVPARAASGARPSTQIDVVLNWFEEVRARVPVR
jgi:Tol biopolymer transport system component